MKRTAALLLLTAACGSSTPPPATPVPPPQKEAKERPTAPASREPLFVEVVAIQKEWVTKYVPTEPDDVKKWAETAQVEPVCWWVLVKSTDANHPKTSDAATRTKAQKLLDRAKTEPFSKVARDASDGGELSKNQTERLPKTVRDACSDFKLNETSPLVKHPDGWAFVRRAAPGDESLAKAYREAKAAETTKRLGEELTKRLRNSHDLREAVADAVQAVLGDSAVADPSRPKMNVVDRQRIKELKSLSEAAKAGLGQFADQARPGDVLDVPVNDGDTVIVARAVAAGG